MRFHAVVAFDLQGATAAQYAQLDLDMSFFARVFKRGSPSNMYVGDIDAADVPAATAELERKIRIAFDINDLHGSVRFWLAAEFFEASFDL